ncbi:MAG: UDP-3-O-(3-hydroxymyristoyl)glucosamine N-acyltransferase, partial [Phycisphaerales bacterium JB039]
LLQIAAEQAAGPARAPGRDPSAVVEEGAQVAPSAHIGPQCVVRAGASIGEGALLIAQVYIGRDARIGAGATLHPGVRVLDRCEVGQRSIIHANTVIGADGFGYLPAPGGAGLIKIPHVGSVRIGSDVEIGACSCVDRGKLGPTIIADGAKIDNLVQIAHNCEIGRSVVICGQSGLSGSVRIGDGATLGGNVGVSDNLTIGAGARIGARSGVMNNVPPGESWIGAPAMNMREQLPNMAALRKLASTLRDLRRAIKRLEEQS